MEHEFRHWTDLCMGPMKEDQLWPLFHENSKTSRYDSFPSTDQVRRRMEKLYRTLPYDGFPEIPLAVPAGALNATLSQSLESRRSVRELEPGLISTDTLAVLLHSACGITRPRDDTGRPLRTAPSAGALFPIDIYVASFNVADLSAGLYHFNPEKFSLHCLNTGINQASFDGMFIQDDLPRRSSVLVFMAASFERIVFKYGDRGYRFLLIEAGHIGQNICLAAAALDLTSIPIGGYYDRKVDTALSCDGIHQSVVYIVAVGKAR